MITSQTDIVNHYLYPSSLFVSDAPAMITTVLGSCISVCLHDPVKKFGGMNHYMLPLWNGDGLASVKFGNIAIEKLIDQMIRIGSRKSNLEAKLFGGANQANFTIKIGERNIEIARKMLKEKGIPVLAESVGGHIGRKIIMDTSNGQVRMRYVGTEHKLLK